MSKMYLWDIIAGYVILLYNLAKGVSSNMGVMPK